MIDLKGGQVESFKEALLKGFSEADLTILLRTELDVKLSDVVARDKFEKMVFDLVLWAEERTRLDELLAATLKARPRSPWLRRFSVEVALTSDGNPTPQLEACILQGVPFQDTVSWRARMEQAERCVCRVETQVGRPIGTGFLVGPDVIMTNSHVAGQFGSDGAGIVRFDYRKDAAGNVPVDGRSHVFANDWRIDESTVQGAGFVEGLDYALIRLVDHPGDERGVLRPGIHRFVQDEPILILQHPEATPLKLGVGSVSDLGRLPNRVGYNANTEPGSSGSPCFDVGWNLIALHHYGERGVENRGIPLAAIVTCLREKNLATELGW